MANSLKTIFRIRSVLIGLLICIVLVTLIFSVFAKNLEAYAAVSDAADDLLIVDCLLPGQIRKLGRRAVFQTARRPVRTTAKDCEIRGGEYVAYDRSSYASALKVWLPKAQEGDPESQNYVGEIYEKGLGLQPDYQAAAEWYKRAAERGNSTAQINLGSLYERGLGVPKNPTTALYWYRRASGLGEEISFVPSKELKELKVEVERGKQEIGMLRNQLNQTQSDLDNTRRELERRKKGVETQQRKLEESRRELERLQQQSTRQTAQTSNPELKALTRQLSEREAELERQRQQIATLEKDAESYRTRQQDSESVRKQLQLKEREAEALKQKADNQLLKLESTRKELEEKQKALSASTPNTEKIKEIENQKVQLEAELERQRQQIATLEKDAESYRTRQQDSESVRKQLESKERELQALKQKADNQLLKLESTRKELEEKQKALSASTANNARIEQIEKQKEQLEAELEKQKSNMNEIRNNFEQLKAKAEMQSGKLARLENQAPEVADSGPIIQMIDPKIEITRGIKERIKTRSGSERSIVGKVIASAGLKSFTVNGIEKQIDNSGLFQFKERVQTKEIPLTLVAVDKKGRSSSLEFLLAPEVESAPEPDIKNFGQYYALIIGNYDYTNPNWPDLKSPKNDVAMVDRILRERYGFKTEVLLNASRNDILQALNKYQQQLNSGDNFLIYYAGHGQLDEELNRGYWIPVDGEDNKSRANWISTLVIADFLSVMRASHILIVADSCYSGSFTRSSLPEIDAGISPEALKTMLSKHSRLALTSGDLQPVLDTGGGTNSVFAKAFIDALRGNHKLLAGQNLYNQVYNSVILKTEQVPQYAPIRFAGHQAGDYFFVPVN